MPNAIPRGRFVWHELLTSDPDGATSFYTKLIGWGTQIWEGGPDPYRMWMNGGTSVGGVMELPDQAKQQGAPPHWLAYIATPDVDQTIKDAETRGGRVLSGPMDIPTIGRIAVMADPQVRSSRPIPQRARRRDMTEYHSSARPPGTSSPRVIRSRRSTSTASCSAG